MTDTRAHLVQRAALVAMLLLAAACRDTHNDGAVAPVPSVLPTARLLVTLPAAGDSVTIMEIHVTGISSR